MRHRLAGPVALTLIACVLMNATSAAVDSRGAVYVGGTAAVPPAVNHPPIPGTFDIADPQIFTFSFFGDNRLSIPYAQIIELEYGQKAGRRVGIALATGLLLTPLGLFALMSKKRNHFLTITYKDDAGAEQVAIFEIGKDIVRTTLAIVQTRSGQKIQYQDEEARKYGAGS